MTDLLTAAEYAAIAETLSFSGNAFIDGAFRPAASGRTLPTLNPTRVVTVSPCTTTAAGVRSHRGTARRCS